MLCPCCACQPAVMAGYGERRAAAARRPRCPPPLTPTPNNARAPSPSPRRSPRRPLVAPPSPPQNVLGGPIVYEEYTIDPSLAVEQSKKAIVAIVVSAVATSAFVLLRFGPGFAAAAFLCMASSGIFAICCFALGQYEINLPFVVRGCGSACVRACVRACGSACVRASCGEGEGRGDWQGRGCSSSGGGGGGSQAISGAWWGCWEGVRRRSDGSGGGHTPSEADETPAAPPTHPNLPAAVGCAHRVLL